MSEIGELVATVVVLAVFVVQVAARILAARLPDPERSSPAPARPVRSAPRAATPARRRQRPRATSVRGGAPSPAPLSVRPRAHLADAASAREAMIHAAILGPCRALDP